MNRRPGPQAPAHYALRIEGHLDEHWSTWFADMALSHEVDGTTTLRGPVVDQAALHGLIAQVRDIGATLISVQSTGPLAGDGAAGSAPASPGRPTHASIHGGQTGQ